VGRAAESAAAIARFLVEDPRVSHVFYPGLAHHPGHEIARRQMPGGFGGMLSFRVAAGAEAAERVARETRWFLDATSLGGVESLIERRGPVEGPDSGLPDDLLRLSVGVEDARDLIEDLDRALSEP
jgi:cystathionine gamma-synthase